jgi:predicted dehydrogenase
MSLDPIRTAVIGCGSRGNKHIQAAFQRDALEIVCVCDTAAERAKKCAADWDVPVYGDPEEIFADNRIEAVSIVTNVSGHLPLATKALAAGKHLIVEKPLGDDVGEARKFVTQSQQGDRVVYVSFQNRFKAQLAEIKKHAENLDPVQIFWGRSRGMMKPQHLNPHPFSGIMDVCAHDFDMVRWFMGRNPIAVTAVLRRNTFTETTDAVDVLSALLDFGDGRSATLVNSIGAREIGDKCDISGRGGNLSLTAAGKLTGVYFPPGDAEGDKRPMNFAAVEERNPDIGLQRAFQAEVREGTPSDAAGPSDGLDSLLLTLACLRSAEQRRRVELSEITHNITHAGCLAP